MRWVALSLLVWVGCDHSPPQIVDLEKKRIFPRPTKDEVALVGNLPIRLKDYLYLKKRLPRESNDKVLELLVAYRLVLKEAISSHPSLSLTQKKELYSWVQHHLTEAPTPLESPESELPDSLNWILQRNPFLNWLERKKKQIRIQTNQALLDKLQ